MEGSMLLKKGLQHKLQILQNTQKTSHFLNVYLWKCLIVEKKFHFFLRNIVKKKESSTYCHMSDAICDGQRHFSPDLLSTSSSLNNLSVKYNSWRMTSDFVIIIIIPSAGFPPKQLFVNKMHCFIDTQLSGDLVMSHCDKRRGTLKEERRGCPKRNTIRHLFAL